jgi:hypothetical protein
MNNRDNDYKITSDNGILICSDTFYIQPDGWHIVIPNAYETYERHYKYMSITKTKD